MALSAPDMNDCCKKAKCPCGSPNAGMVYDTCDPCKGQPGSFNPDTCDCEGNGVCYGTKASYTPCGGGESVCFRNASLRCEEELGGCPSYVETGDTSGYGCEPTDPSGFNLYTVWQYPDGSFANVSAASGVNVKIEGAEVVALTKVECGSGACSGFED